jgi:predicted nucleic acid-binding protein
MTIIDAAPIAAHVILGSMAVTGELYRVKDDELRADIIGFYTATPCVDVDVVTENNVRALEFQAAGIGVIDSIHLATAEAAGADYLLTVDDDFERIATGKNLSSVRVINPLIFLAEGIK